MKGTNTSAWRGRQAAALEQAEIATKGRPQMSKPEDRDELENELNGIINRMGILNRDIHCPPVVPEHLQGGAFLEASKAIIEEHDRKRGEYLALSRRRDEIQGRLRCLQLASESKEESEPWAIS